VARIASYALQAGVTERELIIRLSLKIGFLHKILVKINEFVQKVLPAITKIDDFLIKVRDLFIEIDKALASLRIIATIVPPLRPVVTVLLSASARFTQFIAETQVVVDDLRNIVQEFDISEILADVAVNELVTKG